MWKYIKAAFAVKQQIPILGAIPINVIILPVFILLGIVHPAFLLFGLGFEIALVALLSSSHRFRNVVDASSQSQKQQLDNDKRIELLSKLSDSDRQRFLKLENRISQTQQSYEQFGSPSSISAPNLESLHSLSWIYLKLIFARTALTGTEGEQNALHLEKQIASLKQELGNTQASRSVRKSKEATLEILNRRLQHFEKRNDTLEEIDADLTRIEAQVELARDNAKLQANSEAVSIDVDLASDTMKSVWYYGEADDAIKSLEEQYLEKSQHTGQIFAQYN